MLEILVFIFVIKIYYVSNVFCFREFYFFSFSFWFDLICWIGISKVGLGNALDNKFYVTSPTSVGATGVFLNTHAKNSV